MPDWGRDGGEASLGLPLVEWDDVGVFGRDELERFNESNLRISACEYAAPTTRFVSRPVLFGAFSRGGGFQNGDAESERSTWTISCCCEGFFPLPEEENMAMLLY